MCARTAVRRLYTRHRVSASWLSDSTVENTVQRSVSTSADATAGTTQPRIAYTVCTGCPGHNDIASGTSYERDEE